VNSPWQSYPQVAWQGIDYPSGYCNVAGNVIFPIARA
jgi:hypothetical protein